MVTQDKNSLCWLLFCLLNNIMMCRNFDLMLTDRDSLQQGKRVTPRQETSFVCLFDAYIVNAFVRTCSYLLISARCDRKLQQIRLECRMPVNERGWRAKEYALPKLFLSIIIEYAPLLITLREGGWYWGIDVQ